MKSEKLRELENSFESGMISKEEYDQQKEEIEILPDEVHIEDKPKDEPKEEVKQRLSSDKMLLIIAILVIGGFLTVFGIRLMSPEQVPETIEDLHEYNYGGKLNPSMGYLHEGIYSFVKFEDAWYTQLKSPQGTRIYNIQFRYNPKEVADIPIFGILDNNKLNNATDYYVTFNPVDGNFSAMALAVGDFNEHMSKIFYKQPIAACDRNESTACIGRPIITCENTDKIVLYIKDSNVSSVRFEDNCVTVEGNGFELVRGIDRVLYNFYDIMK
jgi:hypothetical protein